NQSLAATASLQTGSRSTFAALSSPTGRGTTTTSLGGTMPKLGPTPSPTPPQGYDQCDVEAGEGDGMCMGWVPGDPCGEGPGNTCLCTIGGNTVGGGNTCADGSYACSLVKPCSTDPNAPACPSGFVCVSKDAHCCNVTYDICVPGCGLPS
ncbi:MAG: hypothetical protein KDD53_02940, partial [Bdellovibrionales bacterium]|nr:hypothetical protein [Bdellovibrionales bacterium]